MKVGFFISGKGRLFQSAINHQHKLGITPSLAVLDTKSDRESLLPFCQKHNISVYCLNSTRSQEIRTELLEVFDPASVDLAALTFNHLIPPTLLEKTRFINVHMSLLPSFTGFGAIPRALESGVRFVGATIHEANPAVDAGAIISQCLVATGPTDDETSVGTRLYPRLEIMYLQVLKWYAEKRVFKDANQKIWIQGANYSDAFTVPTPEILLK